ncbi:MAG: hypothetical protein IKB71_08375, partial [Lentisphaeria bacterium]|nr:hypothetical protein [Lentisphaeria bacterium]
MSTIYVNAEWNADSVLPEGLVWGENAFATTKEAYMAARNIGGEITIDLTGAGAESLDSTVGLGKAGKDGVYTITGGDINTTSYGLSFADTNTTVNVKDATFKIAKIYVANEGGKFNVDNSVIGSAYYSGNNGGWATAGNGSYTINNSIFGINFNNFTAEELASMPRSASALKEAIAAGTADYVAACANNSGYHFGTAGLADITDSTMMTTWISLIDRAEMNLDNSVLYYGGGVSIGAGQIDSSLGQYNSNEIGWDAQIWWNPPLSSAEGFREGEVATMNVVDSIVRNIGGGNGTEGGHFQVGGSFTNGFDESITGECAGVLNIINSDFSTSVYGNDGNVIAKDYDMLVVKSNGVVNVTDSKLTTSKLINDGVFNVNGESTLSIGTLTGTYIRFEDAEIVGDSNIGGNICTFGDFKVGADLTYKQGNFYGNTTIESGATLDGSITIVGSGAEFALADGSNLNSRFFNIMGTADVAGNVVLKHSDPRQKCLQVFDGGIININAGADFTIDGHCGIVKEGGNLNIEGGNLNIIRWDGRDIGGILYNDGTVTVNSGNVDIYEVINNN